MKKIIFAIVISIAIAFNASAQNQYDDVVYLKNGSVIHGVIIEQVPNQEIKIQTKDGNIFVYKIDDVQKMTKEVSKPTINQYQQQRKPVVYYAQSPKPQKQPKEPKIRDPFFVKYSGDVNIGFATGSKTDIAYYDIMDEEPEKSTIKSNFSRPIFSTTHGVQIYKYAFVGAGVGLQYMYGRMLKDIDESDRWKTLLIPIYLNLKGMYPINEKLTPFVTLSLGYSVAVPTNSELSSKITYYDETITSKLNGGFHCEFGVGLRVKKFNFSLGLQHQRLNYIYEEKGEYNVDRDEKRFRNTSFYFNVGVNF